MPNAGMRLFQALAETGELPTAPVAFAGERRSAGGQKKVKPDSNTSISDGLPPRPGVGGKLRKPARD